MGKRVVLLSATGAVALLVAAGPQRVALDAQGTMGTIVGHVRLTAPAPPSPVIRMGGDPRCAAANGGRRVTQDFVVRSADGGLAHTFVSLQGSFPTTPVPSQPVALDQRGCLFVPRMIGARVGQTLQITNSDGTAHNVHSLSERGNAFNMSQPLKAMTNTFTLTSEDVVMRVKCDIHSWMVAWIGVVPHPYFAVSGADGAFTIARVPPGRYAVQTWHEAYGRLTRTVDVKAGQTATVDLVYSGKEKPSTAGVIDLVIPGDAPSATLIAAR
ncbi:MAG: carboxypeptidase regulatory-like domain-containing protein [Acidobacteria bacterium]|nr:carboxypeptidase regulatory-like domain-containing protein [Acidobacteriota bacterium]